MFEKKKFEVEYMVRLHETDSDERVCPFIEIGEHEIPGMVQIRTTTKESKAYYGDIDLPLTPDKAIQLGHAIIHIAKMMKPD